MLQPGWLKQQKFIFSQIWRLEVQDQDVAGLASPEASLLGFQMTTISLSPHVAFPLSSCTPGVFLFIFPPCAVIPVRLDWGLPV